MCEAKPEWNFVLIGPEDEKFKSSALHKLPNVYFPGLKKEQELPSYLAQFDVAINPQLINEVTVGNYPRKIDEYLAMGKPVVATANVTMQMFKDFVYLGRTAEDHISNITEALNENSDELKNKRVEFAHSHTWANSVTAINQAILKVHSKN